jgi:hypothetical protein
MATEGAKSMDKNIRPMDTLADLNQAIDSSRARLETFLAALTEVQSSLQDDHGWTVLDHLTHIAVWEDSVAVLFRGKPRFEALGVDEAFYAEASFDEINEIVRKRSQGTQLGQARADWVRIHDELMGRIRSLSEAEVTRRVSDFFPQAPRTDDRLVIDLLYENTAQHINEHLPWMQAIAGHLA